MKINLQGKYKHLAVEVDADVYDWAKDMKWYYSKTPNGGYVMSQRIDGKQRLVHRLIMKPLPGMIVDHKDGNRLDNRRSNLRVCTYSQNQGNSRPRRSWKKYKGIYFEQIHPNRPWRAYISDKLYLMALGSYATDEEAALAYDIAAIQLFGEYAKTNLL